MAALSSPSSFNQNSQVARAPLAAYQNPTLVQRAKTYGWGATAAVIDCTFGTHWAVVQRQAAARTVRHAASDRQVAQKLLSSDEGLENFSAATRQEMRKNAATTMLFSGHKSRAATTRKHAYGEGVGAGGVLFGVGYTIGPQTTGGLTAGLTAASVPLLWISGPLLGLVAGTMAVVEARRAVRAQQLLPKIQRVLKNPVTGDEAEVHMLLRQHVHLQRRLAWVKSASFLGLAASAPLAVLAFVPGLIAVIPSAAGLTWAWQHHHARLHYKPSLTVIERAGLGGRRDMGSHMLMHYRTYTTLKALKGAARAKYAFGTKSVLGFRQAAQLLTKVQSATRPPKPVPPPEHIVMAFLQAQSSHEAEHLRREQRLLHHERGKTVCEKKIKELQAKQHVLRAWAQTHLHAREALRTTDGREYDSRHVAVGFLAYLSRYQLVDLFLNYSITHKRNRTSLVSHGIVTRGTQHFELNLHHVEQLVRTDDAAAQCMCQFAERYLLVAEKRRVTQRRHELADFMLHRLNLPKPRLRHPVVALNSSGQPYSHGGSR